MDKEVFDLLNNGEVKIKFMKVDGTERVMRATTNKSLIPEAYRPKEFTEPNDKYQRVFDLDANSWKSFLWENFKEAYVD